MRHAACLVSALFLSLTSLVAQTPAPAAPHEPQPLECFAVDKHGEWLIVPVRVGDKQRSFLLDTGATFIAYDKTLLTGKPREFSKLLTPKGEVEISLHD